MAERVQEIETRREVKPTIYAYTTPNNLDNDGWVKIGYTDRDAKTRIDEQTRTANLMYDLLWEHDAFYASKNDENELEYFKDSDFHSYLVRNDIVRRPSSEWFFFNSEPEKSESLFMNFTFKKDSKDKEYEGAKYELRVEQAEAVNAAYNYFTENDGVEFLWNAKPRFGKTLSAYDLACKLDAQNVLVITNRPAIANSWYEDFEKFIEWQTDYVFVSESPSLKKFEHKTFTRDQFVDEATKGGVGKLKQIAFISLQDLKGSLYFGGGYEKLRWVSQLDWDLLIIDEAHEGIDTTKTDVAFDNLKRKYTLHLSGTPFKQMANNKFPEEAIYNWSYVDEQDAKEAWDRDSHNPYSNLPKLNMFTYQMSNMIRDELTAGADEEDNIDYAFDLNEFFSTKESGAFQYEDDVKKWLDTLTDNEKYPFSTYELRQELRHTFWFLDRVASARALEKLLKEHKVFENYEVVVVAGKTTEEDYDGEKNKEALDRVRYAIEKSGKPTITISVGQLTTGVTVPEWSAVLMLNNVKSPALYMQAAFRAQNPHEWQGVDSRGHDTLYQKNNAYIFDFAPERTLIILDEFANNLNPTTVQGYGTTEDREKNIRILLNFFPVIGEDNEGKMVELDARQVMTIPKNIKAREVVRRGFMSNLLFANISGIFQAPRAVLDIINKFDKTEEGRQASHQPDIKPEDVETVDVDDEGDVVVDGRIVINTSDDIFGGKQYDVTTVVKPETIEKTKKPAEEKSSKLAKDLSKQVAESLRNAGAFDSMRTELGLSNRKIEQREKDIEERVTSVVERFETDQKVQQAHELDDLKIKLDKTETEEQRVEIQTTFETRQKELLEEASKGLLDTINKTVETYQKDTVEDLVRERKEKEKTSIEDDIRSRLRGFARTIPSFIMAYGDRELTLENFDDYTPDDVFKEVTGITIDQFKFLRDGGEYFDEEAGENRYFKGKLFDEIVFDQSVQEFLDKQEELSNYFDEELNEDIFDYIPNQQTNQIFTPKWVVEMMVDQLEEENPNIYDDSSKTFIDLYMKSGLYITEIVKRLYNSEVIMQELPDDLDRLKHILENQVYGLAPTEIIYRIAIRFIFGNFDETISQKNFKCFDAYPDAEAGTLEEKLDEIFADN